MTGATEAVGVDGGTTDQYFQPGSRALCWVPGRIVNVFNLEPPDYTSMSFSLLRGHPTDPEDAQIGTHGKLGVAAQFNIYYRV